MSLSYFLDTVKWFQVLQYNSHNSTSVICLPTQFVLFDPYRTLSGATTPGQSGPGRNGNEGIVHIPQISQAGALPSDGLMSYPGDLLEGLTPQQR